MSIDTPGKQMFSYSNTTDSFNYIDTYVEYFTEVVLKYEKAIPESKHRQHRELQQHKQFQIIYSTVEVMPGPVSTFRYLTKNNFNYFDKFAYQFIKEVTPPPPWFA